MPFDKETARRYGDRGRATQVRRRTQDDLSCYEGDPVRFMEALVDPETGEQFIPLPCPRQVPRGGVHGHRGRATSLPRAGVQCPQEVRYDGFGASPLATPRVSATVLQPRCDAGLRVARTLSEVLRRALDSWANRGPGAR